MGSPPDGAAFSTVTSRNRPTESKHSDATAPAAATADGDSGNIAADSSLAKDPVQYMVVVVVGAGGGTVTIVIWGGGSVLVVVGTVVVGGDGWAVVLVVVVLDSLAVVTVFNVDGEEPLVQPATRTAARTARATTRSLTPSSLPHLGALVLVDTEVDCSRPAVSAGRNHAQASPVAVP